MLTRDGMSACSTVCSAASFVISARTVSRLRRGEQIFGGEREQSELAGRFLCRDACLEVTEKLSLRMRGSRAPMRWPGGSGGIGSLARFGHRAASFVDQWDIPVVLFAGDAIPHLRRVRRFAWLARTTRTLLQPARDDRSAVRARS